MRPMAGKLEKNFRLQRERSSWLHRANSSEDFYVGLEHFDRRCLTLWDPDSGDDATSNNKSILQGRSLVREAPSVFSK